jgi:hypothetical protein
MGKVFEGRATVSYDHGYDPGWEPAERERDALRGWAKTVRILGRQQKRFLGRPFGINYALACAFSHRFLSTFLESGGILA